MCCSSKNMKLFADDTSLVVSHKFLSVSEIETFVQSGGYSSLAFG